MHNLFDAEAEGLVGLDTHDNANRAWATRRKQGWHRRTTAEWKAQLLAIAEARKLGKRELARARKQLTKRYRSKSREWFIINQWRDRLG